MKKDRKHVGATILALIMLCSVWSGYALADGELLNGLPGCYRYLTEGVAAAYSDGTIEVHQEPGSESDVVGALLQGQHVLVEQVDNATGWAYIRYKPNDTQRYWNFTDADERGWVGPYRVVCVYTAEDYVVVNQNSGDRLNLRTKPNASATSLGKYYTGTLVSKQEEPSGGYMKVKIGHMVGYMDTRYLVKGLTCAAPELPLLKVTGGQGRGTELHKLPQNDSEIIKTAPEGAQVTALGVRADDWVQVMYENEIGFARADLLWPRLNYQYGGHTANGGKVLYVGNADLADRLNLREKPSAEAKSLGKFYNGTPVTVMGSEGKWVQVTIGRQLGWMDSTYLKELDTALDGSIKVQVHANTAFTELPSESSVSGIGFSGGTILSLYGDLTDGWHYGCYRSGDGQTYWGYIHESSIERDLKKDLSHENGAAG